jgi:hypothetical protein
VVPEFKMPWGCVIDNIAKEVSMRILLLCFTVALVALTAQGCATSGSDRRQQREASASTDSRKEAIINGLIPEEGLPSNRRARLIDATVAVLHKPDREELQSLNRLRATLRDASLHDLERIEADYKERLRGAK